MEGGILMISIGHGRIPGVLIDMLFDRKSTVINEICFTRNPIFYFVKFKLLFDLNKLRESNQMSTSIWNFIELIEKIRLNIRHLNFQTI
jgi:hypothetical protein